MFRIARNVFICLAIFTWRHCCISYAVITVLIKRGGEGSDLKRFSQDITEYPCRLPPR